jgi:plasmid maintenance system antidote protein VapI
MTETGFLNGLRPRSAWYVLPNLGRWLFILITFVYLLAVALALFEALKLQSLVKSLAGSDETRARAAMLALDEHEGWVGTEDGLKYAAMMIALDKLNAVTRSLGSLNGSFRFVGSDDRDGGVRPADGFENNVNQLEIALIDLRQAVTESTRGVSVAGSLAKLGPMIDSLKGYSLDGGDAAPSDPEASEPLRQATAERSLDDTAARQLRDTAQLQIEFSALIQQLDDLRQGIETEAPAELVNYGLEDLQRSAAALSEAMARKRVNYADVVNLKATDACLESSKSGVSQVCAQTVDMAPGEQSVYALPDDVFLHEHDAPLTYTAFWLSDGKETSLPPWLSFDSDLRTFCASPADDHVGAHRISVKASDSNGAEERLVLTFQVGKGIDPDAVDPIGNTAAPDADAQISAQPIAATSESPGSDAPASAEPLSTAPAVTACRLPDYRKRLDGLSAQLTALELTLTKADPELARAKELTAQIVAIEEAAAWLERLKPGDLRYGGAEGEQSGSAAVAVFNQQRQLLTDTASALKSILGDYSPALAVSLALDGDPEAQFKAGVIWSDFQALERFEPILLPLRGLDAIGLPTVIASVGLRPQGLATLGNEVLILILVLAIGAIGSLIYMTKRQLGGALQGASWTDKPDVGFAWYLFRPIFGMVVAFAIYLMYKAGQIALGGDGTEAFAGINVPILSVIALFAGLLSWQVLDMIEGRGRAWLGATERQDLWATGLDNALRSTGRSLQECADQVGRTVGQVERWIGCRDRLTPEIQDRLTTWLGRSRAELFGDQRPERAIDARPMWASGLQRALTSKGRALDARGLAEILDEDPDRVERWLKRELQVSPAMQWRIVDVLGARHSELFELDDREMDRWAVGLRRALQSSGLNGADDLARRIGASTARVRAWMELQELVPLAMQGEVARVLGLGERELFADSKPDKNRMLWATRLRDQLRARNRTAADLAKSLDVELDQVHAWLDLDLERGRVAPATQERIAKELDEPADQIFGAARDGDAFRWGVGLKDALAAWGNSHVELARQIDADPERVRRWIDLKEPLPPAAQRALAAILPVIPGTPLFSDRKPAP